MDIFRLAGKTARMIGELTHSLWFGRGAASAVRPSPPPPPNPPRVARSPWPPERAEEVEAIIVDELWNLPLDEAAKRLHVLVAPPVRQMVATELPRLTQDQIRDRVRGILVHDRPLPEVGRWTSDVGSPGQDPPEEGPEYAERAPGSALRDLAPIGDLTPDETLEPTMQNPPEHEEQFIAAVAEVAPPLIPVEQLPQEYTEPPAPQVTEVARLLEETAAGSVVEVVPADLAVLDTAHYETTSPAPVPEPEALSASEELPSPPTAPEQPVLPDSVLLSRGPLWGNNPESSVLPGAPPLPSPLDALAQAMDQQLAAAPASAEEGPAPELQFDLPAEPMLVPEQTMEPLSWPVVETDSDEQEVVDAYTTPSDVVAADESAVKKGGLQEELSDYWGSFLLDEQAPPEQEMSVAKPGITDFSQWHFMKSDQQIPTPHVAPEVAAREAGEAVEDSTRLQVTEIPRSLRLPPRQVYPLRPAVTETSGTEDVAGLWDNVIPVEQQVGSPVPATLPVAPVAFTPQTAPEMRRETTFLQYPVSSHPTVPLQQAPAVEAIEQMFPVPYPGEEEETVEPAMTRAAVRWGLLLIPLLVLFIGSTACAYFLLYQPAKKEATRLETTLAALRAQVHPSSVPTPPPAVELIKLVEQVREFNLMGDPDYLFSSDKRVSAQLQRLHRFTAAHGAQLASVEVTELTSSKATPTPAPSPTAMQIVGKGKKSKLEASPSTPLAVIGKKKPVGQPAPGAELAPVLAVAPTVGVLTRQVHVTLVGSYPSLVAVVDFLNRQPLPVQVQSIEVSREAGKAESEEQPGAKPGTETKKPSVNLVEAKITVAYHFLYSTSPLVSATVGPPVPVVSAPPLPPTAAPPALPLSHK